MAAGTDGSCSQETAARRSDRGPDRGPARERLGPILAHFFRFFFFLAAPKAMEMGPETEGKIDNLGESDISWLVINNK